jgi:hypothetical protein
MRRRLSPCLLLLFAGAGCGDPSEVVIFVDTALGVPCQVDQLEIRVTGAGETTVRTADPAAGPQSLTVLREDGGSSFDVEVMATRAGRPVASARADAFFLDETRQALSVVLDASCRDQPCDFSQSLGDFSVPAPATRPSCTGISDRYTVERAAFVPTTDACIVGVALQESLGTFDVTDGEEKPLSSDALTGALAGFDFRFYGRRIETIRVADDGYVSFGAEAPRALASRVAIGDLTAPGAPEMSVVAFWEDLQVRPPGDVCVALLGPPGEATLWITWKNVCFGRACAATDDLTFTVGLEERTNDVIIGFIDMASPTNPERAQGSMAAVGIRGPGPDTGCQASACDASGVCADGTTPCGFTQYFARAPQPRDAWPTTLLFSPEGN